jgi:hypothetical protein
MNFISRESLSKLKKTVGEPIFVEKWEGYVNIKGWSGKDRADFITKISQSKTISEIPQDAPEEDKKAMISENLPSLFELMTDVVIISVCDENGVLLFDNSNQEDREIVSSLDLTTLQNLFSECSSRNGLLETDLKKEIKNLDSIQKNDSTLI